MHATSILCIRLEKKVIRKKIPVPLTYLKEISNSFGSHYGAAIVGDIRLIKFTPEMDLLFLGLDCIRNVTI